MSDKKTPTQPTATVPSATPWPPPSQDQEVTTIFNARVASLDTLRCAVANLEGALDRIKAKADNEGIDACWSEWSDVLRHSQTVWAAEHRLASLKKLQAFEGRQ